MKSIIADTIAIGKFDLNAITLKINKLWVEGVLGDTERDDLMAQARKKADPRDSYGDWKDVTDSLAKKIETINAELAELKQAVQGLNGGALPGVPEPGEQGETEPLNSNGTAAWSEYVPPTGAHNTYNTGDKITFRGERYVSNHDNNVWSPFAYPAYWDKVTA